MCAHVKAHAYRPYTARASLGTSIYERTKSTFAPSNFALRQVNQMVRYLCLPLWLTGCHCQQTNHCPCTLITLLRAHLFPHYLQESEALFPSASSTVQEEQSHSKKRMLLRTQHPGLRHLGGFCSKLALEFGLLA